MSLGITMLNFLRASINSSQYHYKEMLAIKETGGRQGDGDGLNYLRRRSDKTIQGTRGKRRFPKYRYASILIRHLSSGSSLDRTYLFVIFYTFVASSS